LSTAVIDIGDRIKEGIIRELVKARHYIFTEKSTKLNMGRSQKGLRYTIKILTVKIMMLRTLKRCREPIICKNIEGDALRLCDKTLIIFDILQKSGMVVKKALSGMYIMARKHIKRENLLPGSAVPAGKSLRIYPEWSRAGSAQINVSLSIEETQALTMRSGSVIIVRGLSQLINTLRPKHAPAAVPIRIGI
jgi:hypothetical protein